MKIYEKLKRFFNGLGSGAETFCFLKNWGGSVLEGLSGKTFRRHFWVEERLLEEILSWKFQIDFLKSFLQKFLIIYQIFPKFSWKINQKSSLNENLLGKPKYRANNHFSNINFLKIAWQLNLLPQIFPPHSIIPRKTSSVRHKKE